MRNGRRGIGLRGVASVALVVSAVTIPAVSPADARGSGARPTAQTIAMRMGALRPSIDMARFTHATKAPIDTEHVFVRMRPSVRASGLARIASLPAVLNAKAVGGTRWTAVKTAPGRAAETAARLARDPAVAQVEPSYIRKISSVPNDTLYGSKQASSYNPLRLEQAWDYGHGSGQVVAVLDSGVDRDHPDLAGRLLTGRNILHPSSPPQDDNGHGTMTAGIVVARHNNARGISGIAPSAQVLPVKVIDSDGFGNDADIAEGLDWAVSQGADVVNMSLGSSEQSDVLRDAVAAAIAADVVVVAAAGNDGDEITNYPASYPGVISVAATGPDGSFAYFSSYNWDVDVAAPGMAITSTGLGSTERYETGDGTSFASPIVAGIATLLRSEYPSDTQEEIAARIKTNARDMGANGQDRFYGSGLVDAFAATGNGTRLPPAPRMPTGLDEPNDTSDHATPITTGVSHNASFGYEGDSDWYSIHLVPGWYYPDGNLPDNGGDEDPHQFFPSLSLYDANGNFAWSLLSNLGFPAVHIETESDYLIEFHNQFGSSTGTFAWQMISFTDPVRRFGEADGFGVGYEARSAAVADVSGDGRNDVISSMPQLDAIVVFEQRADRSRVLAQVVLTDDASGGGMVAGDLDGDDDADVALPTAAGIDFFEQEGGQLQDAEVIAPGLVAAQLAIADVDGDTAADLVAAGAFGVKVLWGPGFDTSTLVTTRATTGGIAVGDVTGDAKPDVVTCCALNALRVYPRADVRTFSPVKPYSAASGSGVAIGEVTGDANADVVVTIKKTLPASAVNVYSGNGAGGLSAPVVKKLSQANAGPIAIADVNNDAKRDIVVLHDPVTTQPIPGFTETHGTAGLLRGLGGTSYGNEERFSLFPDGTQKAYAARALALGDIDSDARADVVAADMVGPMWLIQNSGVLPALEPSWLRDGAPGGAAFDVAPEVAPTIQFRRPIDDASITSDTVRLIDADGAAVPADLDFDSGTQTLTVTPVDALLAYPTNAAAGFALRVDGVEDEDGNVYAGDGLHFWAGPKPDKTSPQTTIGSKPPATTTNGTANFTFTSNEGSSTFMCSVDGAQAVVCTSPRSFAVAKGTHTFRVFATDPTGNPDFSAAAYTWKRT